MWLMKFGSWEPGYFFWVNDNFSDICQKITLDNLLSILWNYKQWYLLSPLREKYVLAWILSDILEISQWSTFSIVLQVRVILGMITKELHIPYSPNPYQVDQSVYLTRSLWTEGSTPESFPGQEQSCSIQQMQSNCHHCKHLMAYVAYDKRIQYEWHDAQANLRTKKSKECYS